MIRKKITCKKHIVSPKGVNTLVPNVKTLPKNTYCDYKGYLRILEELDEAVKKALYMIADMYGYTFKNINSLSEIQNFLKILPILYILSAILALLAFEFVTFLLFILYIFLCINVGLYIIARIRTKYLYQKF